MKVKKSIRLKLSCYCCGGIDFENTERNCNEVEGMYFLDLEDKEKVKCLTCGLEDYLHNLVPRGFTHFIPYNINKIAKELEVINKSLKRIADKEE